MSTRNDPAFPVIGVAEWHNYPGMTKLEWFAGMAMQGMLANSGLDTDTDSEVISWSFNLAEGMIAESERRK